MNQAPETLEGWYALHDIRQVDWAAWEALAPQQRDAAVDEFVRYLERVLRVEDAPEGSSALYSVLGHKGDLMVLHLRPTLKELNRLELELDRTRLAQVLRRTYSFVSVIELSTYGSGGQKGEGDPLENPYLKRRLHFQIPDTSHVCFYPMNKRRGERENWYLLPPEERAALMREHGEVGRRYGDRVTQMITGAVGFDDWEWGVTLFGNDPLAFKKLVYEMRFDEASARYAEFGSFFVGVRLEPREVPGYLSL